MNDKPEIEVGKLPVITKFIYTLGVLPTSYLMSMTYQEQVTWLYNYLQTQVVPLLNTESSAIQELQTLYELLRTYVNDYFDNLDVQEEINNKLDEMVQDGTLNEIINQEIFGNINQRLNLLDTKKIVLIGDSYLEGYNPDGNVTSWGTLFKQYLGLNDNQVIMSYLGGSSFGGSRPFTNLVNGLTADNDVTDVIVAGGYNDNSISASNITSGFNSFKSACNSKFPNAKIHCAMIGWSNDSSKIYNLFSTCYRYMLNCTRLGIHFMNNTQYSLHNYYQFFASDGYHPSSTGQESIARNIVNAFLTGSATMLLPYRAISLTPSGICTEITGSLNNFSNEMNNNLLQISSQGRLIFACDGTSYNTNALTDLQVADITDSYVIGSNYKMTSIPVQVIVKYTTSESTTPVFIKTMANLIFRNSKLYFNFAEVINNNYGSINIQEIQLYSFSGNFDSLFC